MVMTRSIIDLIIIIIIIQINDYDDDDASTPFKRTATKAHAVVYKFNWKVLFSAVF